MRQASRRDRGRRHGPAGYGALGLAAVVLACAGACTPASEDLSAPIAGPSVSARPAAAGSTPAGPGGQDEPDQALSFVALDTGLAITSGDGTAVIGRRPDSSPAQAWQLQGIGDDVVNVRSLASKQCLTAAVPNGEGVVVRTAACTNAPEQQFTLLAGDNGNGWDFVAIRLGAVIKSASTEGGPLLVIPSGQNAGHGFAKFPSYAGN